MQDTCASLETYIQKITYTEKNGQNNYGDLFEKSFSALRLIQKIPALRQSLHKNIYLIFEESLIMHSKRSVNGFVDESEIDIYLHELMEKLIREIQILIDTNSEFWGLIFFQVFHFLESGLLNSLLNKH